MSTMRLPPKWVCMTTRPALARRHFADDGRIAAERMRRHGAKRCLRIGGRHDNDDLALIGEIERIKP